tara:strand:- start:284 stop:997 length:714 start_codon:yes stop_codon:yes gene_type:complete
MAFNLRSPGLPVGQSPFSQKSSQTNPLYERGQTKAEIAGESARAADDLARKNKATMSKGKALKPGEGVLKTPEKKAKLTKSQESFVKDPSGLGKTIKKASKPKITGKIGSDLRRQQYKKYNLKDDATTKRAKAKTVGTLKAKGVKDVVAKKPKDFRSADKPAEKKAPKLAAKRAPKKELSKMEARKTKKINKKLSQAAEARANGNEKKALRKERAAARKTRRIATLNARKAKRSAKK